MTYNAAKLHGEITAQCLDSLLFAQNHLIKTGFKCRNISQLSNAMGPIVNRSPHRLRCNEKYRAFLEASMIHFLEDETSRKNKRPDSVFSKEMRNLKARNDFLKNALDQMDRRLSALMMTPAKQSESHLGDGKLDVAFEMLATILDRVHDVGIVLDSQTNEIRDLSAHPNKSVLIPAAKTLDYAKWLESRRSSS
ncbi:hypothetical protein [Sphingomonas sp. AX6]|uniref:hypothetical protein n=1 Tax=Sphingomonas sp. AX6 TaxID=2653171 RepID=UPI0012F3400A|nr:hypothetical protein [Sphingomonas sp. AX6]VXC96274.1 hypothetical protein SPHINGOAX6_70606 [Sphingomonas sp. AX6]